MSLKSSLLICVLLFIGSILFGQNKETDFQIVINPQVGYYTHDFLIKKYGLLSTANSKHHDLRLSYGGEIQFLFSNSFGVSLKYNFAHIDQTWTHNTNAGFTFFGYEEPNVADYHRGRTYKMRFMVGFNWYKERSEDFCTYWSWCVGAKRTVRQVTAIGHTVSNSLKPIYWPTTRIGYGLRWFFTPNVGVNAELGLGGGSPVMIGLMCKF